MFTNKKVAFLALCITLLTAATASAQTLTSQAMTNYDDQLALDVTPVPPGSGAIFVPTLSNPQNESYVVVYYQGAKVTAGKTGQRIVVPPGEYEVVIATGDKDQAAKSRARVVDGATIIMEPFYGGVKLDAVNTSGEAIEMTYGIKQNGQRLVKSTTPTKSDESPRTFLLAPGPKTWEFDNGTEIAFDVPQGELVSYRAVFDKDRFIGLEHASSPLQVAGEKWWRARMTIGADVSGAYSKHQMSDFSGIYGQLGAFLDTEVGVDYRNNLLTLKLNVDESWVIVDSDYGASVPLRSLRDKGKAELLYAYRLARVFGPFVRATAETTFFGNKFYGTDQTTFKDGETGNALTPKTSKKHVTTLAKPLFPLYVEGAAGINLTVLDNSVFDFVLLAGVAYKYNRFGKNSYFITEENGNEVTLKKLKTEKMWGPLVEARLGLRLGQSFRIAATGKMFYKANDLKNITKKFNPLYSVSGLAEFSINSFASLVLRGEYELPTYQMVDSKGKNKPSIYAGGSLRLQHNLF